MNEMTKRNTDDTLEKLMALNLQTAGNINALSNQLGIVSNKVDALGVEVSLVKDRMQTFEDTIRVTRAQADAIKRAIHSRVCLILGIEYKDGVVVGEKIRIDKYYRPGFISKLYSDARRFSELGTPYYETFRRDYGAVLDYINGWLPQVGVEGYMLYLDERRRSKNERDRA